MKAFFACRASPFDGLRARPLKKDLMLSPSKHERAAPRVSKGGAFEGRRAFRQRDQAAAGRRARSWGTSRKPMSGPLGTMQVGLTFSWR